MTDSHLPGAEPGTGAGSGNDPVQYLERGPLSDIFDGGPDKSVGGPLLSLRDVTVAFGGVAALSGLTFDVDAHDIVAIVGPNGAGKSTTLNAVSGLVREHATGQIFLEGRPVLGKAAIAIARAGVGRSFQDPPLIDTETVVENVLLGEHLRLGYRMVDQIFRPRHVERVEKEARSRAMSLLEFAGLVDLSDRVVGSLSYGTRKLIDIARAMMSGPRLLLLDEPTSGLDADEQAAVGRILIELHRTTPVTILVVEHHMDVVRTVANKVVGMAVGSALSIGTPEEVLDSDEFRSAIMGGKAAPGASGAGDIPAEQSRQIIT
jgi:branched-chain amino acid transport system ATP-binding protein